MNNRFGLKEHCITDIVTVLKLQPEVEEAIIFGSRAMGTYKNGSDIDIALKGEKITFDTISTLRLRLDELPYLYMYDIINYKKISNPAVTAHIDELGITFYKKQIMPSEWKTYKLGEIADDIAMGPFGSNLKVDNFIESGVPVIRGMNLNDGGFTNDSFAFVSEEKANSLKRCLAYPDDLVFTHRGTLGQVGIIPFNQYPKYLVSQSQMRLSVNKNYLLPKYLYYFFKSPFGQRELLKNASQVGVPAIANPTKSLKQVEITAPSLPTQRQIAQILSSLDDKIELNLQMNKTLEAMAQAIFKEWFVNFNFPGSDGELVDGLPKGWRKVNLTDLLSTISVTHKFPKGEAIFLNTSDILDGKFLHRNFSSKESLPGQAKKTIQKGDILFTEIRPANRRYAFVDFDADDYVVSTKLMVLRSKGLIDNLVIYYFMKSDEVLQQLQSLAESRSGTFPQITYDELAKVSMVIADLNTQMAYADFLSSVFGKVRENEKQIEYLTQLRDTLLPKLMSGQLEVKK